jgi:hypothetical protein
MEKDNPSTGGNCAQRCEQRYLNCVSRSYTGCVEVLRVCRERCARESQPDRGTISLVAVSR